MLKKIFSRGGNSDEPTATRAKMGQESTMYYCPEKKRWRERGKESEEVEEVAAAPPPKVGEMPKAPVPSTEPAKEQSQADMMCAVPSAYRNFGAKPPSGSSASPAGGPPSSGPPVGGAFGTAAVQANPFAPKPAGGTGFGGTVTNATNPNAPRGMNPNAPRGAAERRERRERPKPKPFAARSAFGAGPAYSPMPQTSGDPEGGDDDPEGDGTARPGFDAAPAANVEGDEGSKPQGVKPAPKPFGVRPGVRPFGAMPGVMPPGVMPPGVMPPGVLPPGVMPQAPTLNDEEGEAKEDGELPKEAEAEQPELPSSPKFGLDDHVDDAPKSVEACDPEGVAAVQEEAAEVVAEACDPEGAAVEAEAAEVVAEACDPEGAAAVEAEAAEVVAEVPEAAEFEEAEDGEVVGQIPAAQEPVEEGEIVGEEEEAKKEEPAAQVDNVINEAKPEVEPETETPAAQVEDAVPEAAPEVQVEESKAVDSAPEETAEGWGDVDLDIDLAAASEDVPQPEEKATEEVAPVEQVAPETEKSAEEPIAVVPAASDDGGWDDFDCDWDEPTPKKPDQATDNQQEAPVEEAEAADKGMPAEAQTEAGAVAATSEGLADLKAPSNGESVSSWVDLGGNSERETPPPISSGDSPPSTTAEAPPLPDEVTPVEAAAPAAEGAQEEAAPQESVPAEAMPEVTEAAPKEPESAEAEAERRQREELLEGRLNKELEAKRDYMEQIESMRQEMLEDRRRMAEMEEQRLQQDKKLEQMAEEQKEAAAREARSSEDLQANNALAAKDEELTILRAQVSESKVSNETVSEQVQQLTEQKEASEKRERDLIEQKESLEKVAKSSEATELRLAEMSEALKAAQQRAEKAEERLAETDTPASPKAAINFNMGSSPGGMAGDEFNLPDFVWNCGNSQVMEYVQQLCTDNVALKRQMASCESPGLDASENVSPMKDIQMTSSLFDTADVNVDRAMAFLSTLGDNDGHQIPPLLTLLADHASNVQVCSKICAALENLTFADTENRSSIVERNGVEAILKFMQQHEDAESALLRPAVDALWNITFDDEAVARMAETGNHLENFLAVVQKHVEASELQAGACAVLLNLAVKEQNRWKIVQLGGVTLISTAMQRHSQCEEVLEQGCQALYMLAYHQDIRPIVLEKCGDAASLAASYPHGAGRVQKWGRWLQEVLAC